jgi:predicted porin
MLGMMIMAATLRFFGSAGAEAQLTPASHESPLNPGNIAAIPYQTNIGDATAFIEASTDDKRWKLRAKLRAEASDQSVDRGEIGEAFVQFAVTDWLDVTAGRVIEKWGTGYGWTPTAFVGPAKNPTDPGDRRSTYRGRDMVRADIFVKDTSLSLYALEGGAVAAKVYRLIRGTDVSLVYRRENGTHDAGINFSRVFGDALEVHAEVARTSHTRAVIGAQYTFAGNMNVVLEVYHGTDGLTSRQWQSFRDSVGDDLRGANAAYAPLRMARTYAFTRISRPFGKADLELITISSTRDRSTLVRAGATYKIHPNVSLYAIETELIGGAQSELAYLQVERITTAGLRVYF